MAKQIIIFGSVLRTNELILRNRKKDINMGSSIKISDICLKVVVRKYKAPIAACR